MCVIDLIDLIDVYFFYPDIQNDKLYNSLQSNRNTYGYIINITCYSAVQLVEVKNVRQ